MNKSSKILVIVYLLFIYNIGYTEEFKSEKLKLPEPCYKGKVSLESVLKERRSIRTFRNKPLTLSEISQLLWAGQGITSARGLRTAPSAGALYPLELYIVAGKVKDLKSGIYKYLPYGHELLKISDGDKREELKKAALQQSSISKAPAVIILSAVYERTTIKYGERGIRYVQQEVGHAAQNILLQAVSLNLKSVIIGAFEDDYVKRLLNMKEREQPLCLIPIGK